MSHKLNLSQLDRGGDVSLTQQLVDLVVAAIEAGELDPGEKLPPTRALAEEAGVNHLTAARAYRRLAELGYVSASVGRGTFVRSLKPSAGAEVGDQWQAYALPDRPPSYAAEVLSDTTRLADDPEVIPLSVGYPSPALYPIDELADIAARVFEEERGGAIDYLSAEGLPALREELARHGRTAGFAEHPDEIIVTSGAHQALDLAARAILEPGDVAVVESPSFIGILTALRGAGARAIGVPVEEEGGFDVDAFERVLTRHDVKLVVLQPACQNPTGRDISPERRERLAELALERNLFVIEDAVYADLRYEGEPVRPLREIAPEHVVHVNSLSKVVGGGLRTGWAAARGPVFERIASLKRDSDLHSASLTQHISARFMASGGYERHLERVVPVYRERRDLLIAALERHMPGEYAAARPVGGHHLWVELTGDVDERLLYTEAVRAGVSFTPGAAVYAQRHFTPSMRLSFGYAEPDQLDEGVRRLAGAVREVRRRRHYRGSAPVS